MSADGPTFRRGVIQPVECYSAGWRLVQDRYWLFVGMSAVAMLLGAVAPFGVLMGPMMCGLMIALLTRLRGQPVEFELVFKGFDYFVPSLLATLVQMGLVMAVLLPIYAVGFVVFFAGIAGSAAAGSDALGAAVMVVGLVTFFVLVLVLMVLVSALFAFIYPLVVDRKLSGWDACRTSAAAAWANVGGVVGLVLLNFVTAFAGMLLCYVGAFLVLPIQFAALAVAYRQVFPDEGAVLTNAASPLARTSG